MPFFQLTMLLFLGATLPFLNFVYYRVCLYLLILPIDKVLTAFEHFQQMIFHHLNNDVFISHFVNTVFYITTGCMEALPEYRDSPDVYTIVDGRTQP